ncbi:hypothetical protein FVE85_8770 [Porphyridium purpureum]|uniref:Uncharacterized protein n=1 Tax=Porphyridium purpureum TaxID=35688 RepID=A0A5J4YQ41_PORPP|nr:hypothetical protein FVE85_8770 [Porphyridium purpureum]|eukprot:POR8429..scf296_7
MLWLSEGELSPNELVCTQNMQSTIVRWKLRNATVLSTLGPWTSYRQRRLAVCVNDRLIMSNYPGDDDQALLRKPIASLGQVGKVHTELDTGNCKQIV